MTERYDTYLQVRLTTHDKERIKARAVEAGLKTSEYVRKRALGERVSLLDDSPPASPLGILDSPRVRRASNRYVPSTYAKATRLPKG